MAPYFGSVSYMRAHSYHEFKAAMLHWGAPTENMVYADISGNIAWVPGGLTPVRPNWDGLLPVPGDGGYEWAGFLPGDKLPSVYNPARGYLTTSNEMNLPAGYPYRERKLGFEWADDSRHRRIESVLQSSKKVSIEDSMKLQNDDVSLPAQRLVTLLSRLKSDDAQTKAALELLRGWDGNEIAESPQAALMEVWVSHHLGRAFLNAVLPAAVADSISHPDMAVMLDALEKPETHFGSGVSAADKRDHLLLESLAAAWREMQKLEGQDPKKWQWGRLHHSFPIHVLAGAADGELYSRLQPGPFPTAGDPYTPNQSSYRTNDFVQTNGPSFRMVLDVGNWDNSRAVNYPGQSGNVDDPHYRDLAQMWLNGEYFPLLYSRKAIEAATEQRITLLPARK